MHGDGQTDGRSDVQTNRRTDGHIVERQTSIWIDRGMDMQTDGLSDRPTDHDRRIDMRLDRRTLTHTRETERDGERERERREGYYIEKEGETRVEQER